MRIKSFFISIIAITLLCSCENLNNKDDSLTLVKTNYSGNQLRIDGYYYQKDDNTYYTVYFLYGNGILLYGGGGYSQSNLNRFEEEIKSGYFYGLAKDLKDYWGLFEISSNFIRFERWYPSSGGAMHAYIRAGEILNDTTFRINMSVRSDGAEERAKDEVYHFKKFSPKPDSINTYIN